MNDAELADGLNRLCPNAWQRAREHYGAYIRAVCSRLTIYLDPDDVEQECWLYLLTKAPDIQPRNLTPLLLAAIRYQIQKAKHDAWRRRRDAQLFWLTKSEPDQELRLIDQDIARSAAAALQLVTPAECQALVSLYNKDQSAAEAAAELGIDEKALRKRIERGRERIRTAGDARVMRAYAERPDGSRWPIVTDETLSVYFCNKRSRRNRDRRRAGLTVRMGVPHE